MQLHAGEWRFLRGPRGVSRDSLDRRAAPWNFGTGDGRAVLGGFGRGGDELVETVVQEEVGEEEERGGGEGREGRGDSCSCSWGALVGSCRDSDGLEEAVAHEELGEPEG
jgi:hypothetical protein